MSSPLYAFHRVFLMLTIGLLTAFTPEPTTAVPVQGTKFVPILPHPIDLPPITLKFFQDRMHKIDRDTCVFYYHLAEEAKAWARKRQPSLTTVWWAFEDKTYDDEESPLKDYADANKAVEYWEVMCEAYTIACSGHSSVLIKPVDPSEPTNSIWTRIEYDTIKKGKSGIIEVVRVDEKGENGVTIWSKPETGTALQAGKNGRPPSPIGGQPSMYQNGPPGGS